MGDGKTIPITMKVIFDLPNYKGKIVKRIEMANNFCTQSCTTNSLSDIEAFSIVKIFSIFDKHDTLPLFIVS